MPAALTTPRHTAAQRVRLPGLAALLGVLALHAVLLVLATRLSVWPDRVSGRGQPPPTRAPMVMWLLERASIQATRATEPAPSRSQSQPTRGARRDRTMPAQPMQPVSPLTAASPAEPQPITLQVTAPAAPPAPASPGPTLNGASPPPAALNLALPRAASAAWRQRNPALDDARANTRAPVSLAALIDKALGGDPDGPISEERLADGSVRFRRGQQCVISRPNQAQNIDPFNGSVLPKPRLLDKC